jgi:integrase
MTAGLSSSDVLSSSLPIWHMPVVLENYSHPDPSVTEEEAALLDFYATDANHVTGGRAFAILAQLERFDRPFRDALWLHTKYDRVTARSRRHVFRHMAQTRWAFWAWSPEVWNQVIQTTTGGSHRNEGMRFGMLILAYLFSGFLYTGEGTPYIEMADAIFGEVRIGAEANKLQAPLVALGYSEHGEEKKRFRRICALAMLVNRSPYAEALSAQTLLQVNELLPSVLPRARVDRRQDLVRLQTALCHLSILDEPVIFVPKGKQAVHPPTLWQNDPTVDPVWMAWVCAFYEQTPHQVEKTLRETCCYLIIAGRWLKETHPEISHPAQWSEALAAEYVTHTCQALRGDYMSPSHVRYAQFQQAPQPLSPAGMNHRLQAMRVFFSTLQRRGYTVNGSYIPRLRLTWLPEEAFKTPDDIRAASQPNPRDIAEDTWFKLIWAACTLSKEHLETASIFNYPLAYYRAASLIWVTAARRMDEIRRLSVGCVRREWVPEMRDEQGLPVEPAEELCYLRVPTNKMRGEFYVPIPSYVADAIEVWESVRPPNQEPLPDRKTHKLTSYLFQYRNERMGPTFLNDSAIPPLCKLAGVSQIDIVGRITSHRARATTATWLRKMGMAPADIGKLLGHTNPAKSLPWYMREDKHHLGRAYRKANPLERYVAAILDTNAQARQEPCVFYYLADGPHGRPRMCGNPHFSRCSHQMMCRECEAFIDSELAEVIEKREGSLLISVPIPLPPQMVDELNAQDEASSDVTTRLEARPPPTLPSPAFHFNKKVPMRSPTTAAEEIDARLQQVEAQIAKKQGKTDQRSASLQALLKERAALQARLEAQEKGL